MPIQFWIILLSILRIIGGGKSSIYTNYKIQSKPYIVQNMHYFNLIKCNTKKITKLKKTTINLFPIILWLLICCNYKLQMKQQTTPLTKKANCWLSITLIKIRAQHFYDPRVTLSISVGNDSRYKSYYDTNQLDFKIKSFFFSKSTKNATKANSLTIF